MRNIQALNDIKHLIRHHKDSNFYKPEDLIDAIDQFLSNHFQKRLITKTAWKLRNNISELVEDLKILTNRQIADKYSCSLPAVLYRREKHGIPRVKL